MALNGSPSIDPVGGDEQRPFWSVMTTGVFTPLPRMVFETSCLPLDEMTIVDRPWTRNCSFDTT